MSQVDHGAGRLYHGILLVVLHQVRETVQLFPTTHIILPVVLETHTEVRKCTYISNYDMPNNEINL